MKRHFLAIARLFVLPVAVVSMASPSFGSPEQEALAAGDPVDFVVENLDGSQFVYVVFHALRDGFCNPPTGAVSLHPVLDMPVDFQIEAGDGIIVETSGGSGAGVFGRTANDVKTFSTAVNAASASPVRAFAPLVDGLADECQAWIKVSQSIPGPLRVLVTVPGDGGGELGFIADLERPTSLNVTLNFRWSLVTWQGADGITPTAALRGPGGGPDITGSVTAIFGWDAVTQSWRAYFPSGAGVPGANDLAALKTGTPYWVAIAGPGALTWPVAQAN